MNFISYFLEIFYRTLKSMVGDSIKRNKLNDVLEYICWNINEISKNIFKNYFQKCMHQMAEHIMAISKLKDENYINP